MIIPCFEVQELTLTSPPIRMGQKIRVAAVSYLNTKPLLFGIERSEILQEIELLLDYPSQLAEMLGAGTIDIALLPVAAIPGIEGARIVSDYGIASDGNVASVALFSHVPMEEITEVYLDYQSRTSVKLAQVLLENYWRREVTLIPAGKNYIQEIAGKRAGVIIGDRALQQLANFEYVYDLSAAWKQWTGLDFVFAAWVAARELPADFLQRFNEANAAGFAHLDEIIAAHPFPEYDLRTYYTENIQYLLTVERKKGLARFLSLL